VFFLLFYVRDLFQKILMTRIVDLSTFKTLVVRVQCFSAGTFNINAWISHNQKTLNLIDHIFIDRRRYSSILDVIFQGD